MLRLGLASDQNILGAYGADRPIFCVVLVSWEIIYRKRLVLNRIWSFIRAQSEVDIRVQYQRGRSQFLGHIQ